MLSDVDLSDSIRDGDLNDGLGGHVVVVAAITRYHESLAVVLRFGQGIED